MSRPEGFGRQEHVGSGHLYTYGSGCGAGAGWLGDCCEYRSCATENERVEGCGRRGGCLVTIRWKERILAASEVEGASMGTWDQAQFPLPNNMHHREPCPDPSRVLRADPDACCGSLNPALMASQRTHVIARLRSFPVGAPCMRGRECVMQHSPTFPGTPLSLTSRFQTVARRSWTLAALY